MIETNYMDYRQRSAETMYGSSYNGSSLTRGYTKRLPRSGGLWESDPYRTGIPWPPYPSNDAYREVYHDPRYKYKVRIIYSEIKLVSIAYNNPCRKHKE